MTANQPQSEILVWTLEHEKDVSGKTKEILIKSIV